MCSMLRWPALLTSFEVSSSGPWPWTVRPTLRASSRMAAYAGLVQARVHLHEVGALGLDLAYGGSRGGRVVDDEDVQKVRVPQGRVAVDDLAGHDHPRAEQRTGVDPVAPVVEHRVGGGHLADHGQAVGQVQRGRHPLVAEAVDVHVGESRDDVLAGGVDHGRAARDGEPADADDPVAADQDGLVAIPAAGGDVDDGGVGEGGESAFEGFAEAVAGAGRERATGDHGGAGGGTGEELTARTVHAPHYSRRARAGQGLQAPGPR